MKIGIFGGTFNPLHNGHLTLARAFLEQEKLDEVWLMVSPQNPFKVNQQLLPDSLRLQMAQEALADEKRIKASNFEFALPKPSYTWHTLQALSEHYPEHTFTLLIGGDNWAAFDRWYHHDDILRNYAIAVFPREGSPIDASSLPRNVRLLHVPLITVSSTEVRERVRRGESIAHLVPTSIAADISRMKLYV